MKAVIFAAGLGTRLRPLTEEIPKPLIAVGGRPILERTLASLPAIIEEALVIVGYKSRAIREAGFFSRADRPVRFIEQARLGGTLDALFQAEPFLGGGPFLALNGDDLYSKDDLESLSSGEPFAVLAKTVVGNNRYSHLATDGGGSLKEIVSCHLFENQPDPVKNVYTGACLLDRRVFCLEPSKLPDGELSLPHTLGDHLPTHPVRVVKAGFWMPVGTLEELEAARAAIERI